jgi:hypothetical protein
MIHPHRHCQELVVFGLVRSSSASDDQAGGQQAPRGGWAATDGPGELRAIHYPDGDVLPDPDEPAGRARPGRRRWRLPVPRPRLASWNT